MARHVVPLEKVEEELNTALHQSWGQDHEDLVQWVNRYGQTLVDIAKGNPTIQVLEYET